MQLTGGEGGSRGVGLAMRRAGYPVRARIVKKRRLQLISVLGVHEEAMPEPGEIDKDGVRAYELSVWSDQALERGDLAKARELMTEAAVLDGRYSVRAELVGRRDERGVRVASTMRKRLIVTLLQEGFGCRDGAPWKPGEFLERRTHGITQALLLGPVKFGGAIAVMACRENGNMVAYFDWKNSSLRSGRLNYRTQEELETVCERWVKVLREEVFPWLEHGDA